jgi:hypothetical protein
MKCLIVIDMQWSFRASRHRWLRKRIEAKIKEFVARGDMIVFVEYGPLDIRVKNGGRGPTAKPLLRAAEGGCVKKVLKNIDNGAIDLKRYVFGDDLCEDAITEIQICGVNLNACVSSTAYGLANKYPTIPIKLLMDLSSDGWDHPSEQKKFENHGYPANIETVYTHSDPPVTPFFQRADVERNVKGRLLNRAFVFYDEVAGKWTWAG